ncbi:MAG: cobalt-precorrin-5B (C(1))-methyltransferase CbiD [Candidatus Omnitrophota bacterium]|nr:cobalt-precorrin-5B (C(1))-methyltransferase CbiD [Candidatus Omnitrophota bacterium]
MDKKIKRKGITTGACAQAAARACAVMLRDGRRIDSIDIILPNGESCVVPLIGQEISGGYARCGVVKDSGEEESDVTNGIEIFCAIEEKRGRGIEIVGGKGVGKATRPGLAVKAGESAINPTPRKMIMRDVKAVLPKDKGYSVEISVPRGEEIAKKTYNPRLGVIGGISIIGTTGIVKPKSQESYKDSLIVELNVACAAGYTTVFIASGYLGEKLLIEKYAIQPQRIIKVGDHVGFMLEKCAERGIKKVMLIGHIGKLVKVAAGIFNTHNKTGDARMETIAAYAAAAGASQSLVRELLESDLAEASIDILKSHNISGVFDGIAKRVVQRCNQLCGNEIEIRAVLLSLKGEVVGMHPANTFEKEQWGKFIS